MVFALLVVVAVAGLGVVGAFAAGSAPSLDLPTVGAQDLVASTIRAAESGRPISGSVTTHVDLGLPDIPTSMGGGPSGIESVIGDQRFKVWSSPDGLRVSQLLPFAERVFVGSPTDVWTWNSDQDLAVHTSMDASTRRAVSRNLTSALGDPVQLADELLRATSGVADVSVSAPQDDLHVASHADVDRDEDRTRRRLDRRGDAATPPRAGVPARERRARDRGGVLLGGLRCDRSVDVRVHASSRRHGEAGGSRARVR